jgi:hypothetical protein
VTFDLQACQFHLSARRVIRFPRGQAGNVVRGALGSIFREIASAEDYARIFEPASAGAGPSGLATPPRPFVIRAAALDGQVVEPGAQFHFGLNLFDAGTLKHFKQAFAQWAEVVSIEQASVMVDLNARSVPVRRIRVEFQTPTELKTARVGTADFSVLLARARDRLSTLRSLYGAGPLEIDFRGLAERAQSVKTVRCELRRIEVERRSSRTGQRHGIGGFIGVAEYEGDLGEFVPYLEAAHWTGIGRHCTWGNGQIHTEILTPEF